MGTDQRRVGQEFMREHLARVLHQDTQEVVLLGRQLHLFVADFDNAPHQVDGKVADPEHRPLALNLELISKRRPHARQKLLHAKGLRDKVVGAEIELFDLGSFVAAARKHHGRHVFSLSTNLAQKIEPLHIREAKVEMTRPASAIISSAALPLGASRVW
jgi:hypothetical protein